MSETATPKKLSVATIRMAPELYAQVQNTAHTQKMSLNAFAIAAIEEKLARYELEVEPAEPGNGMGE